MGTPMNAEPRAASRGASTDRRMTSHDDARHATHHIITRGSAEFARTRPRGSVGVAALPSLAYFSLILAPTDYFTDQRAVPCIALKSTTRTRTRKRVSPVAFNKKRELPKSLRIE